MKKIKEYEYKKYSNTWLLVVREFEILSRTASSRSQRNYRKCSDTKSTFEQLFHKEYIHVINIHMTKNPGLLFMREIPVKTEWSCDFTSTRMKMTYHTQYYQGYRAIVTYLYLASENVK
jgi:hypothetical protein